MTNDKEVIEQLEKELVRYKESVKHFQFYDPRSKYEDALDMAIVILKLLSLTEAKIDKNIIGMLYHCNFKRNDPTCDGCKNYGRKGISNWLHGAQIAVGICDHGLCGLPGYAGLPGVSDRKCLDCGGYIPTKSWLKSVGKDENKCIGCGSDNIKEVSGENK